MSDILADLAGLEKRPGSPCILSRLRDDDPEMARAFETAVASQYSATAVVRWFKAHDLEISDQTIRKHRSRLCRSCQTS